jgi:hypothetical protein
MKTYQRREIREAMAHAADGGQALHIMSGSMAYLRDDTPSCFKGRREIAHLFDQGQNAIDRDRETIRRARHQG